MNIENTFRPVKKRPVKCKCDPKNWDGWFAICKKYERNEHYQDGRCKNCDHDKECHE